GHLLPGRAAWVRRHTGVALLGAEDADTDAGDGVSPVTQLRRSLAGRPSIVVIDGLDTITDPAGRDQVAAILRDARARARAAGRSLTLIAGAAEHPDEVRSLLASALDVPTRTLDLRAAPDPGIPAPGTATTPGAATTPATTDSPALTEVHA